MKTDSVSPISIPIPVMKQKTKTCSFCKIPNHTATSCESRLSLKLKATEYVLGENEDGLQHWKQWVLGNKMAISVKRTQPITNHFQSNKNLYIFGFWLTTSESRVLNRPIQISDLTFELSEVSNHGAFICRRRYIITGENLFECLCAYNTSKRKKFLYHQKDVVTMNLSQSSSVLETK